MDVYVMRLEAVVGEYAFGDPHDAVGKYVQFFDPDAFNGQGDLLYTSNPNLAHRFTSRDKAVIYYGTQSRVRPFRGDGQPNRPLTTFSMSIITLEEALGGAEAEGEN